MGVGPTRALLLSCLLACSILPNTTGEKNQNQKGAAVSVTNDVGLLKALRAANVSSIVVAADITLGMWSAHLAPLLLLHPYLHAHSIDTSLALHPCSIHVPYHACAAHLEPSLCTPFLSLLTSAQVRHGPSPDRW